MKEREKTALILVATILGSAALVALLVTDGWHIGGENPEGWIYEYQGLIGGTLALIGAAATVWYLRQQINLARDEARNARTLGQAALNRPLVDRLDSLVGLTDTYLGRIYEEKDRAELIGALDEMVGLQQPFVGSELTMIQQLIDAGNDAGSAVRNYLDWLRADRGVTQAEETDIKETAGSSLAAFHDIATWVARGLAEGRSPIELALLSLEELRGFAILPKDW